MSKSHTLAWVVPLCYTSICEGWQPIPQMRALYDLYDLYGAAPESCLRVAQAQRSDDIKPSRSQRVPVGAGKRRCARDVG